MIVPDTRLVRLGLSTAVFSSPCQCDHKDDRDRRSFRGYQKTSVWAAILEVKATSHGSTQTTEDIARAESMLLSHSDAVNAG